MTVPLTEHHITVAGKERTFYAYLPVTYTTALMGLHGAHGTGEGFAYIGDFNVQAEAGIAGVFPTSLRWEGRRAWAMYGPQYEEERAFLLKLKRWLLEKVGCTGVGLLGNSSGGYMSWKMALEDSLREDGEFTFYGPSNANWPHEWAERQKAIPVFIPHGTDDQKIPFDGIDDQWGWRDAMWRMAKINNGGELPDPTTAKSKTVKSCLGKTTTLVEPVTSGRAIAGARVNGGHHALHSCPGWQIQQMMIAWANRNDLWEASLT